MDTNLKNAVRAFIAENREQIIENMARLIAVPSVEGDPMPGCPFGEGPRKALDTALEIAEKLGLSVGQIDHKIGWAEIGGESEDYLATITHVDVVPAGNGWDADPFTLRRKEGWLLGRGVADDKGPAILTLYALKFLKEQGLPLRYGVRALLGCNEETHMQDVPAYLAAEKPPVFLYTPDAEFPVCNGEKGLYTGKLIGGPFVNGKIVDWAGGQATNAVPDRASALVKGDFDQLCEREGITLEREGDMVRVNGWGKSGHAAMPEGTVNAIALVMQYLLDNELCSEQEREYLLALKKLHENTDGSGLGVAADDGRFDPLTIVGGRIRMENGCLVQSMDSRYPTNMNGKKITERVQSAVGKAARAEMVSDTVPFYIEADSPAIRALIETYNEVTGSSEKPFTMGGGTYARKFPFAVSFGPEYPNQQLPAFGGGMHAANECASEEGLLQALEIYILALMKLEQLDFSAQ